MSAQTADWPDRLFQTLKRGGVRQVGYVPDAGHARLIERCRADRDIRDVVLTTEEEGVALAAGAWLGGERAALLMQSSGLGNCVNMFSLARTCRFPLLMFITMRGEWEEFNPWQVPMGSIVDPVLKLCEAEIYRARAPADVAGNAERAIQHAFGDERIAAVILSQELIGRKVWTK
ncbi:MAG TPA: thiamine pyrophosphate-binding protein [Pseudolabrys sp.]|nr:thiamine pyrophosphate-binding protein [Pseudolabrys sp.]